MQTAAGSVCRLGDAAKGLSDSDGVDDALYGSFYFGLAEDEEKFVGFVFGEFVGFHVFEDVDAVFGEHFLMDGEHLVGVFHGKNFDAPGV